MISVDDRVIDLAARFGAPDACRAGLLQPQAARSLCEHQPLRDVEELRDLIVGTKEPFEPSVLRDLCGDKSAYVEQFNRRLAELIAEGWLLPDDADGMRGEADRVEF